MLVLTSYFTSMTSNGLHLPAKIACSL